GRAASTATCIARAVARPGRSAPPRRGRSSRRSDGPAGSTPTSRTSRSSASARPAPTADDRLPGVSPVRPDLVACWLFRLDASGHPEILLIHRAPGRIYEGIWQCVTGRLEARERVVDGALREVSEETGLTRADLEAVYETDLVNWFHED